MRLRAKNGNATKFDDQNLGSSKSGKEDDLRDLKRSINGKSKKAGSNSRFKFFFWRSNDLLSGPKIELS